MPGKTDRNSILDKHTDNRIECCCGEDHELKKGDKYRRWGDKVGREGQIHEENNQNNNDEEDFDGANTGERSEGMWSNSTNEAWNQNNNGDSESVNASEETGNTTETSNPS